MFKTKVFCRYIHTDGLARVRDLLCSPKYTRVNGSLIKKCYNVIYQKNKLPQSLWIISMSLKTIVKVFYLFALWRRDWLERYYAWKVLPKDMISVFSELWISSTHKLVWSIKCHVTCEPKGLLTWRWGTPDRWGNPLRWGKKITLLYLQSYNPSIPGYTFLRLLNGR